MKKLRYYLEKANREGWAIGQFNFSSPEQLKGIVAAAMHLSSPAILGTSEGESSFLGLDFAVWLVRFYRKKGVPLFLNLDHGKSFEILKKAAQAGYDALHFDGSKLPFKENLSNTKRIVKYIRRFNPRLIVEGELGRIQTDSSRVYDKNFEIREEDLTNPEKASIFLNETGVDSLAVSIGNFHGVQVRGKNPRLRLGRLQEIKEKLGKNVFLVLHGGSGTRKDDIKRAIKLGIVKININTELRLAFAESLKKNLLSGEITPYKYFPLAIQEVQKAVEEKIKLFGSEGKI